MRFFGARLWLCLNHCNLPVVHKGSSFISPYPGWPCDYPTIRKHSPPFAFTLHVTIFSLVVRYYHRLSTAEWFQISSFLNALVQNAGLTGLTEMTPLGQETGNSSPCFRRNTPKRSARNQLILRPRLYLGSAWLQQGMWFISRYWTSMDHLNGVYTMTAAVF